MPKMLLLVSSSKGRAQLLTAAGFTFQIVTHRSLEDTDPTGLTPSQLVSAIAKDKMRTLVIPELPISMTEIVALSADTLAFSEDGQSFGKPKDKAHAISMLAKFRAAPIQVVSGCCLKKFSRLANGQWHETHERIFAESAEIFYALPANMLEWYFTAVPDFLSAAGGARVEGPGAQFVQWVRGSYTAIMGLPMFELRQELEAIGF
jgi:septum formation protein